ncbi:MAG: NAD+ synthase [Desulfovibrio sp.]|nr:NAD+ synthase [Desulfovibrio sp.]
MKIALLQCNSVNGDVVGNMQRIAAAMRQAAQAGADLCVTPELALCGVAPGHFLQLDGFVRGCLRALDTLASTFKDGPALLVGTPVPSVYATGLVSNVAVLVEQGNWQVVSRKVYRNLEQSWNMSVEQDEDARYFDRGISCGIVTFKGWRLGIALCEQALNEDGSFWNVGHGGSHNVLTELMRRGVDTLVHMAASPFRQGSQDARERLLSHVAARHHVHLFSVNMVGGNDCRVYNGQSCVFDPTGQLLARGRAFTEDVLTVNTAQGQELNENLQPLCSCDEEAYWHALVLGTRDFVRKCGGQKAIVALSGGMDSALVACVAVAALGADNVTGVLMPSPFNSSGSLTDAAALAANLGMPTVTLPIKKLMHAYTTTLSPGFALFAERPHDVTLENIQARIRGTLVTALANRAGALVLNAGNKSEVAVGYCTLYGDTVGALAVIGDLTKTQVYSVGRWYNAHVGHIPEEIFDKAPSAELRPDQKDEDSLPPYDVLDPVLQDLLCPLASGGKQEDVAQGALRNSVRDMVVRAEFKRRQMPLVLFVSRSPFGTCWRTPVAATLRIPEA